MVVASGGRPKTLPGTTGNGTGATAIVVVGGFSGVETALELAGTGATVTVVEAETNSCEAT